MLGLPGNPELQGWGRGTSHESWAVGCRAGSREQEVDTEHGGKSPVETGRHSACAPGWEGFSVPSAELQPAIMSCLPLFAFLD